MDYRPVYQNLLEIFPQVDSRILKAVAIEHPDDVNGAVEFILYEVLPSIHGPSEASDTVDNSHEVDNDEAAISGSHVKTAVKLREQEVDNRGAEAIQPALVACGTAVSSYSANFMCPFSGLAEEDTVDLENDNRYSSLPVLEENQDIIIYGSLVTDTNRSARECEGQLSSLVECADSVSVSLESPHDMLSSVDQKSTGSVDSRAEVPKNVNISTFCEIEGHPEFLAENCPKHVLCGTEVISLEDSNLPIASSTRSDHLINIDPFQDSITEEKNYEETLVSALESIASMMKEVELPEKRAKQAEEEAANAGQDILAMAEELKRMLQQAQQANIMHAVEVYGDKAILATEAREFQSRLHNLSEEWNKIVSIVQKIQETLEARQAATKDRIAAAELVKLEKVGMVQKICREQEAFLDAIVQESKKLQQEAERNTKLRNFLVDNDEILDTLQGELLVISADAILLNKLAVDEGASLEGSVLMSTYSSASSSSVSRKRTSSVDGLLLSMDLVENNRASNGDPQVVQEQGKIMNIHGTEMADTRSEQRLASDDELKKSVDEREWCSPLMGSLLMPTYSSASPSSSVNTVSSPDGVLPIELVENARGKNEHHFSVQEPENIVNNGGSEKADVSREQQKSAIDDEWELLKCKFSPS